MLYLLFGSVVNNALFQTLNLVCCRWISRPTNAFFGNKATINTHNSKKNARSCRMTAKITSSSSPQDDTISQDVCEGMRFFPLPLLPHIFSMMPILTPNHTTSHHLTASHINQIYQPTTLRCELLPRTRRQRHRPR